MVSGTARFSRSFHRPTGLTPQCQVFLKLEGYRSAGRLLLNDTPLAMLPADQTSGTWPVSERLLPRNTLSVVLQFDPTADDQPGGLFGLVALIIVPAMTSSPGST